MKILKSVLKILLTVIMAVIFIASAVFVIAAKTQKDKGYPGAFGYSIATVKSNSMSGTFEIDDVVIGKITDENTEIKIGDIISYSGMINNTPAIITHRVTDIITDANGVSVYETWGDNRTYDFEGETGICPDPDAGYRTDSEIISVYKYRLPGLGKVIGFIRSKAGFACVVLPVVIMIIYEIVSLISIVIKNREAIVEEKNREREKLLIEKYELELQRLKGGNAKFCEAGESDSLQ